MNEITTVIEEKFTRCPQCRSYSVKVTEDLTPKERFKARFVSVNAFLCHNCSYRFVEYGHFSTTLKNAISTFYHRVERKWLFAVLPLALIVVLIGLFWLIPGGTNSSPINDMGPQQITQEPPPPQETPITEKTETGEPGEEKTIPDEKTGTQTEVSQETGQAQQPETQTPPETSKESTQTTENANGTIPQITPQEEPKISGEIILGVSSRFGVNWNNVSNGVQIIRLSNGPLKTAGLQILDILTEVDGERVLNGNQLLQVRDEVFSGKRESVLIKVLRNEETLYFLLMKNKSNKKKKNLIDNPQINQNPGKNQVNKPEENLTSNPATTLERQSIKIFSQNYLKIRSSAPDEESAANRWVFLKKVISVKRNPQQKVFIAGDASGKKKWAVDDQLIINGHIFKGLADPYQESDNGFLPQSVRLEPLEITKIVPADKEFNLRLELSDHGILWGNTDIFIIVK